MDPVTWTLSHGPCHMRLGPYQAQLQPYHMVIACVFYRLADMMHAAAHTTQHFGMMELCCKKHGEATAAAEPKLADL